MGRSTVRLGRTRRVLAAAVLATLPLAMTACAEEEPAEGGVVEEEVGEEEED